MHLLLRVNDMESKARSNLVGIYPSFEESYADITVKLNRRYPSKKLYRFKQTQIITLNLETQAATRLTPEHSLTILVLARLQMRKALDLGGRKQNQVENFHGD